MKNFVATNDPIKDSSQGSTIAMRASVAAATSADAEACYVVFVLQVLGADGVTWGFPSPRIEHIMGTYVLTTAPQSIDWSYRLPATLPLGEYRSLVSVRDVNWAWQSVSQVPASFKVGPNLVVAPRPLRAMYLPDDGNPYSLVAGASDEFDGTVLDRSKWWTRYKDNSGTLDHYNNELERYVDNHVVANGELLLTARPRAATYTAPNGKVYQLYDSSMIRSRTIFQYGYVEARIKIPPGLGMFPAFWLLPQGAWPPEIDIMESATNGVTERPNMVHVCEASGAPVVWQDPSFNAQWNYVSAPAPYNVSDDYHHYGLLWEPGLITEWFDGKPVAQKKYDWKTRDGADGGFASVIVDLAVGGTWATNNWTTAVATDDQVMHVSYVRVYQRSGSILTGTSPL